jgi:hypothetical protein
MTGFGSDDDGSSETSRFLQAMRSSGVARKKQPLPSIVPVSSGTASSGKVSSGIEEGQEIRRSFLVICGRSGVVWITLLVECSFSCDLVHLDFFSGALLRLWGIGLVLGVTKVEDWTVPLLFMVD